MENTNKIKKIEIDENGLIKDTPYIFDEKGYINWRAMVPPEFLYANPSNKARMEKKYGKLYDQIKPIEDKVEDSDLVITLAGLKHLLRIRRFKSVKYNIKESNENYASINCEILFCGNFETLNEDQVYSENACAHMGNTNNFARQYLLEIASNRALARCIRSYCNINIVSREELGASIENEQDNTPKIAPAKQCSMLKDLMSVKKVTFEHITTKLKNEKKWDEKYTSIEKLPADIIFELLSRIKEYKV